jgi:putative aldouronate transport system substrate-binding protein
MKKRILALLLTTGMLASLTAACGTGGGAPPDETPATVAKSSGDTENDGITPSDDEPATAAEFNDGDKSSPEAETGPFSRYENTVTIHLVRGMNPNDKFDEGKSIEDNDFIDVIREDLNIEVVYDWVSAIADMNQKLNLSIASNDIPDAVVTSDTIFNSMLKYDMLADLTAAFAQNACDMLKGFYFSGGDPLEKLLKFDGELKAVPATSPKATAISELWIRQDWLDALSLNFPTTLEELKTVAKAFIEQDPDGDGMANTVGIMGPTNAGNFSGQDGNPWGFDPVFQIFNAHPRYYLRDSAGNVTYGSIMPETKAALGALAEMYAEGLIDKEMLIRDVNDDMVLDDRAGIFFGPWWMGYTLADSYVKKDAPADWRAYTSLKDENGKYNAHMSSPANSFLCVRKGYEYPEAAIRIVNLLIRDETKWVDSNLGFPPGTGGAYPLYSVFDNVDEVEVSVDYLRRYLLGEVELDDIDYSTHKLLRQDMLAIKELKLAPMDNFSMKYWDVKHELAESNLPRLVSFMAGSYDITYDPDIVEIYSLFYGKTSTMEIRGANLEKLEIETFARIIMGQSPLDYFDAFVENWKLQGGDDILKEVEDAISH